MKETDKSVLSKTVKILLNLKYVFFRYALFNTIFKWLKSSFFYEFMNFVCLFSLNNFNKVFRGLFFVCAARAFQFFKELQMFNNSPTKDFASTTLVPH